MSFKPLTIFITGGSSGLGRDLTLEALKAGHKVIATSRSIEKARKQNPQVAEAGGEWFQLDVNDPATTERVAELAKTKDIDVVVNNAGYAALGAFEDFTDQDAKDQFETNVFGLLRVCRGAVPHLRQKKGGVIVNIGSGAGIKGVETRSLYSGSKFAVAGITESLYAELKPFGVRVILAELGAFATAFGDGVIYAKKDTDAYKDTPTGKLLGMMRSGAITSASAAGRPELAAKRILEAITLQGTGAEMKDDVRLILGSDCLKRAQQKVDEMAAAVERNKNIAPSTDGQKDK